MTELSHTTANTMNSATTTTTSSQNLNNNANGNGNTNDDSQLASSKTAAEMMSHDDTNGKISEYGRYMVRTNKPCTKPGSNMTAANGTTSTLARVTPVTTVPRPNMVRQNSYSSIGSISTKDLLNGSNHTSCTRVSKLNGIHGTFGLPRDFSLSSMQYTETAGQDGHSSIGTMESDFDDDCSFFDGDDDDDDDEDIDIHPHSDSGSDDDDEVDVSVSSGGRKPLMRSVRGAEVRRLRKEEEKVVKTKSHKNHSRAYSNKNKELSTSNHSLPDLMAQRSSHTMRKPPTRIARTPLGTSQHGAGSACSLASLSGRASSKDLLSSMSRDSLHGSSQHGALGYIRTSSTHNSTFDTGLRGSKKPAVRKELLLGNDGGRRGMRSGVVRRNKRTTAIQPPHDPMNEEEFLAMMRKRVAASMEEASLDLNL